MPYNQQIDRPGASALMPEQVASLIMEGMSKQSIIMQMGTRLPNMMRAQERLPILTSLPQVYFVGGTNQYGDNGRKQTTKMTWGNKFIEAGELAAIVPIPIQVLEDSEYDLLEYAKAPLETAFAQKFDAAVLYKPSGTPTNWPTGLFAAAQAAGHEVSLGNSVDLYDAILSEDGVFDRVMVDGYQVTGAIGSLQMPARLRGVRASDGQPIFNRVPGQGMVYELDGRPIMFPDNGAFDATASLMLAGDFKQLVWAMRKDITYTILREASIFDDTGTLVYNFAQDNMVGLRAEMRLGWQVPNQVNWVNQNDATRYPFATLVP